MDLDISDDSFSMMMAGNGSGKMFESFEHVLPALSGSVACAELRERLKAYEDTGLTPERCAEFARAGRGRTVHRNA
ncbi:MAG: hypothetical protein ACLR8L_00150 [Oscillospiraceae bacterium]